MPHQLFKHWIITITSSLVLLLSACSDSVDTNPEDFSVELSDTTFRVVAGQSLTISYVVQKQSEFDIAITVSTPSDNGEFAINQNSEIIYIAGQTLGSLDADIRFSSATAEQTISITITVVADEGNSQNPDPDPVEPEPEAEALTITFPTDYITIFEGEQVEVQFNRNYQPSDEVIESFYFDAHNVTGRVSDSGDSILLYGQDGNIDSYGEVIVSVNVDGKQTTSTLGVVYFNTNVAPTGAEPPVIALLDAQLDLTPYGNTQKVFDVYDPDSDRIAYRITQAPAEIRSHIRKLDQGFEIMLNTVAPLIPGGTLTLEVSDGVSTDEFVFELTAQQPAENADTLNTPPKLTIEKNVTLSKVREILDSSRAFNTELAFVARDDEHDNMNYSVLQSSSTFTSRISYPYLYVEAQDVSALQYEQMTIIANDGQYKSAMTFHFFIEENFIEFMGGNPNIAPFIETETELTLLEGKSTTFSYVASDFEQHAFDVTVEFDDSLVEAEVLEDQQIQVRALYPESVTQTQVTVNATDVFTSQRSALINVTINKNTAPTLSTNTTQLQLVEQVSSEFQLLVNDLEEAGLQPIFSSENGLLTVSYDNQTVTVVSSDINEDQTDNLSIYVEDEYGAFDELIIPVTIQADLPDNAAPVVTLDTIEIELYPGDAGSISTMISDPDNDPVIVEVSTSSSDVVANYSAVGNTLNLSVNNTAAFDQSFNVVIAVSDGFATTQVSVTVIVPTEPAAPEFTIDDYLPEINEQTPFIINYQVSDSNGDTVTLSSSNVAPGLTVSIDEDSQTILVTPPDNVLANTDFEFDLVATDETGLFTQVSVSFTVLPVNDVPQLVLEENAITLENTTPFVLPYDILDPDLDATRIEVDAPAQINVSIDQVSKQITLSGRSKGETGNFNLGIRALDDQSYSEQSLAVELTLVNAVPEIQSHDSVSLLEQRDYTLDLAIIDPDGDTRTNPSGDTLAITVNISAASAAFIQVVSYDLDSIVIRPADVAQKEEAFITINVSDGFDNVTKQIFFVVEPL